MRGRKKDLRKGTPEWLAQEMVVSGNLVRAALRKLYPREEEDVAKRKVWGVLTQKQQGEVKGLVAAYLSSPSPRYKILYPSLR